MEDSKVKNVAEEPATKSKKGEATESVSRVDKHIWGIIISLLLVSVVELYSASSREVASSAVGVYGPILRHCFMLFVGILIIITLQRIHYRWFVPFIPILAIVSACMMIYVLFFGDIINGARRSFTLMGIMIQPAEFLKLSSVLVIALVMSRMQEPRGVKTKGVVICAVSVIIFGGLLFTQGLTNTILLMAISLSMMLIGGVQWKKFFVVLACYGVVAGGALWIKLESADDRAAEASEGTVSATVSPTNRRPTWEARLNRYFGDSIPKYDKPITAENRQEMYSYFAQANGGFFGVFPGNSREAARLPLAFSDYIYSIIIEDMGFLGGFFVLVLYLWLLFRSGNIAGRCNRAFPAMVVLGLAVMIVFQALFHMAIVTGVFPVSGQPLPLISKGGSSILVTSIAFGMMLSISRYGVPAKKPKEKKTLTSVFSTDVDAENPSQLTK